MRRHGKSGVAGFALVMGSALVLALGACSSDSGSASGGATASTSASGSGYTDVVQVAGMAGELSDPRLNGEVTNDPQCELTEVGDRTIGYCTVTETMTNDGGTWEGGCTGTTTWTVTEPEHMHDFDCTLVGAGGYLGLRYRYNIVGGDGPWEITAGRVESFPASPSAS
jgi:hypothetical protein